MTIIERNEEGSRALILARLRELRSRGEDWVEATYALRPCTDNGPWSEDLQALVREGVVECQGAVEELGMKSLVRIYEENK